MTFTSEAAVLREFGTPDVFAIHEIKLPWPGSADDVLVRMEAAGINPADTFFRALGTYLGDGPGTVLGHDGAGVVEAVGDKVESVKVGDRVCFCNGGVGGDHGTYSRHAVVPEWLLAKIPDAVDFVTAASLPLVFITAWEAFVERAQLQAGESVLVHGGAGGSGHVALQIANGLGARVATTVSSTAKAELATSMGAQLVVNYRDEDFVAAVRQWTDGKGVDVAFDNAGAEVFQKTLTAMAPYGRIVTLMGTPGDLEDETAYNNNLSIHNVMMLTPMWFGLEAERRRQGDCVRRAMNWLAEDRIRSNVTATYPLEEVSAAHTQLEKGSMAGKIVLTMS
jgi:NADPH2:quinone reductase